MCPETWKIIQRVVKKTGFSWAELRERGSRKHDVVAARRLLIRTLYARRIKLARRRGVSHHSQFLPYSTPQIGRLLGIDHTTVIYHLGGTKREKFNASNARRLGFVYVRPATEAARLIQAQAKEPAHA